MGEIIVLNSLSDLGSLVRGDKIAFRVGDRSEDNLVGAMHYDYAPGQELDLLLLREEAGSEGKPVAQIQSYSFKEDDVAFDQRTGPLLRKYRLASFPKEDLISTDPLSSRTYNQDLAYTLFLAEV